MKTLSRKSVIILIFLIAILSSYAQLQPSSTRQYKKGQKYGNQNPVGHHQIALEVLTASRKWIDQFNNGNLSACVSGYDQKAVMSAMPFGIKHGTTEISEFWTPIFMAGTKIAYSNVSIEVANETTVFLSANFSMTTCNGVIFQEKWEKKEGKWLLTYDNFQVLEQFETPRNLSGNPVASHTAITNVVEASMKITNHFNVVEIEAFVNGYSENAVMNAVPFAAIRGKEGIRNFWMKLGHDGAKNLIYHNPVFKSITDQCVTVSSRWSMNIGEGKIYQEKWDNIGGDWTLTYDEFEVLKQYQLN